MDPDWKKWFIALLAGIILIGTPDNPSGESRPTVKSEQPRTIQKRESVKNPVSVNTNKREAKKPVSSKVNNTTSTINNKKNNNNDTLHTSNPPAASSNKDQLPQARKDLTPAINIYSPHPASNARVTIECNNNYYVLRWSLPQYGARKELPALKTCNIIDSNVQGFTISYD